MKCEFCGAELSEEHRVCTFCGSVASPTVMNDKSHLIIGMRQQNEIGERLPPREYKLQQSNGFSRQSIDTEMESNDESQKKSSRHKHRGEVTLPQFVTQNQPKEKTRQKVTLDKHCEEKSAPRFKAQNQLGNEFDRNVFWHDRQGENPQTQFGQPCIYDSEQNNSMQGFIPDSFENQSMYQQQPPSELMSKTKFLNLREMRTCRNLIFPAIILLYFSMVISFVQTVSMGDPRMLIDIVIVLVLTFGLQFKQSRACSVALCIYSVLSIWVFLLLGLVLTDCVTNLAAGNLAVCGTFRLERMWRQYKNTGCVPDDYNSINV